MDKTAKDNQSTRIAKNTLFLYGRMVIFLIISLYTSRVILHSLGVVDYGIYNVVTGVVIAFGFLNNAMTASVQRFLSVNFKDKDPLKLNIIFSASLEIHVIIAVFMVIIAEIIGLYLLYNSLVIPANRMTAAFWIFQFSVITLFISIINVPYRSLIITHEDMGPFAIISLVEALTKLGVAFLIGSLLIDRLIVYGLLLALVSLIIQLSYWIFCKKHYIETKYHHYGDKVVYKEMCSFAGWNLIGVFAGIAQNQGVNILLNIFGGPVINASRAIAYQVSGATNQLVTNFQMAVNPPIMKSYTSNFDICMKMVFSSSKISYILMLFIVIPFEIECPYIIKLWLDVTPEFTIIFTRLVLIDAIICSLAGPFHTLFQATGKIKLYQIIISGCLLLNLPLSYILLKIGLNFSYTFIVSILLSIVALVARLILIREISSLKIIYYLEKVIWPISIVSVLSLAVTYTTSLFFQPVMLRTGVVLLTSTITIALTSYYFATTDEERQIIKNIYAKFLRRNK